MIVLRLAARCGTIPSMTTQQNSPKVLRRDARANLERIMAAAPVVLAEGGVEVSMEAIAESAGVGVGTLYRRFATRESLLIAVVDQEADRLEDAARAAAMGDPQDGLINFMKRALASPMTSSAFRRAVIEGTAPGFAQQRVLGALMPAYAALLARAQAAGAVREDLTPADIPLLVMAVAAVARETGGPESDGTRRVLTIVIDGLRPEPSREHALPPIDAAQLLDPLVRSALMSHGAPQDK